MKSGPISLVLFFNLFGAFLRSFALVGPSRAFRPWARAAATSMGKKNQGKKRMQPDAADVATPAPRKRRGKAAGGRPLGIETAARTATSTPSIASMFGGRNAGLPAGKTPSAFVADVRKCEMGFIPEISVIVYQTRVIHWSPADRGDPKSGNYQFYHMLTTFSFLVLKALGYLKGVIR